MSPLPANPAPRLVFHVRLAAAAFVLLLLLGSPVRTEGQAHENHVGGGHGGGEAGATPQVHEHHGAYRNEFMAFVGDTRKAGENSLTFGLDYFRVLGLHWGVGVFLDLATSPIEREYIAGAGVFWAPFDALPELHLLGGLGYERLDEDHHGEWEHENLLLARVGGTYILHFGEGGRWVLAPQAYVDFTEGNDAFVFGVGMGRLF